MDKCMVEIGESIPCSDYSAEDSTGVQDIISNVGIRVSNSI